MHPTYNVLSICRGGNLGERGIVPLKYLGEENCGAFVQLIQFAVGLTREFKSE